MHDTIMASDAANNPFSVAPDVSQSDDGDLGGGHLGNKADASVQDRNNEIGTDGIERDVESNPPMPYDCWDSGADELYESQEMRAKRCDCDWSRGRGYRSAHGPRCTRHGTLPFVLPLLPPLTSNAFISRDRGELTYRESIRAFDACAVAYCIVRSLLPRFIPSHRSYPSIDDTRLSWALEGVRRILAVVADGLAALDNVYPRSMPANLPSGQVPLATKYEALHTRPRGSCGRPRFLCDHSHDDVPQLVSQRGTLERAAFETT